MAQKANINFKKFIWILLVIVLLVLLFFHFRSTPHPSTFTMQKPSAVEQGDSGYAGIDLFVDFSGSMKGFVDFSGYGNDVNVTLRNTLYNALTMSHGYKVCHTSDGKTYSKEEFMRKLGDKSIFSSNTTILHQMLDGYVQTVTDSTVTVIASDLVLSYGRAKLQAEKDPVYNVHNLDQLAGSVKEVSKKLNSVGMDIVILQYLSDFNGKYYCNSTENITPCEFKDTVMKNRPYYIMLIGKQNYLKNMLNEDVFKDYAHAYATFDMKALDEQEFTVVANETMKMNWNIGNDSVNGTGCIYSNTAERDAQGVFTFTCKPFETPRYLTTSSIIDFDNNVISSVVADPQNEDPHATEFRYTVTLRPYGDLGQDVDTWFKLVSDVEWFRNASFKDDVINKSDVHLLEKKTFGFDKVIDNIDQVYRKNGIVSEDIAVFNFNVRKK